MKKHFLNLLGLILLLGTAACSSNAGSDSASNDNNNSAAVPEQLWSVSIDNTAKTFKAYASKLNNGLQVTAIRTDGSGALVESISFEATEGTQTASLSNFVYNVNGVTYQQDPAFSSSLTQHAAGKLKGQFSGNVVYNNQTVTFATTPFDLTYDANLSDESSVASSLHMSFSSPDWNRFIPCDQLNLNPTQLDASTYYVYASSASTNQTFMFSYPADSSAMVAASNLRKYPIAAYFDNQSAFQFSQKFPLNASSSSRLASMAGFSALSFNEVVDVKYKGSEASYAVFEVKCKYRMLMQDVLNTAVVKPVSGTYHLKVRTNKQ